MPAALACSPALIIKSLPKNARRLLLFGEIGIGKSTLARVLARELSSGGHFCFCIAADPGSPAFGAPGAISLAKWHQESWQVLGLEALCSLDAVRFRLPLVSAVRQLAREISHEMLLVDAPGVVRSVAGAELLTALVEAAAIDTVLVLTRNPEKLPLANELASLRTMVLAVQALPEARRPTARARAIQRTRLWDEYLRQAEIRKISISAMPLLGTPPPLPVDRNWRGRQIACLREGRTMALGEILDGSGDVLQLKIRPIREPPEQALIRDAFRNRQGRLATYRHVRESRHCLLPPPDVSPYPGPGRDTGPIPMARLGQATAILVNGIFGDPLLHVRLHNRKRSILFDLGEGTRLPARLAHQVTDVFISHAHIDHIAGFLWLLRSRIGVQTSCRLFGPPGLADNVAGLIGGILWDRFGEWGPRFEVAELDAGRLVLHGLRVGSSRDRQRLAEREVEGGMLLDEPGFKVWAASLRHKAVPVMAYALELRPVLNVERQQLINCGLTPGSWLAELKKHVMAGTSEAKIFLPDGEIATAGELGAKLIRITPAQKLVYATDLDDTAENRRKLTTLARSAHTFFCEAAFIEADRRHAESSGHLTAQACGEIAQAADVEQLVPFHFSRRYEHGPLEIYEEVKAACRRVAVPMNQVIRQKAQG